MCFTTTAQRSISSATDLLNSAGLADGVISKRCLSSASRRAPASSARATSWCRRSTTASGVLAGANRPNQTSALSHRMHVMLRGGDVEACDAISTPMNGISGSPFQ